MVWCHTICFLLLFLFPEETNWKQILPKPLSKSVLPMSSSRNFMVSDLTFKYLTHFEFIFISGVRKPSCLILLHEAVQFSQYYLLKRLFFLILYSCLLCHRLVDHIRSIGLFCVLYSIDVCVCLWSSTILFWLLKLCSIACKQWVWYLQLCSVSRPFWLFVFLCAFFLCFHTNFRVSCSVRNAVGILIGIALKDSTHTKILSQYHWITWLQNPQQISGSQIQQYITYTMTKWGLYQGCKDSLISRSSSVWHITLTNWRIKTIWPCQWKQKKAFDKIQCLLLIKALNKVAMESAYLNIIEAYVAYPQPTPVVKTNTQWWKVESFSFKIKRRQRFSLVLEVLVTAIGQGKEKESKLERKKYTCHCLQMAWYYR